MAPVFGQGEYSERVRYHILYDDISNSINHVDGLGELPPIVADALGDEGTAGHGNNGHGNNEDGVDSSNPGQGSGGDDESCSGSGDCVDDELGH